MRYLKYASGLKSSVVINIDLTISVKLSFLCIRSIVEMGRARHKKNATGGPEIREPLRRGWGAAQHTAVITEFAKRLQNVPAVRRNKGALKKNT